MKISVVVSIYNIENYLKDCVDSLLTQTLQDIEIILVDDGAKDSCPQIIDDYATQYSNVIPVHKKNGGLSSARNEGLKHATGEYVIFVDGDDWLAADALEKLYNSAHENQTDMTLCCFYRSRAGENIAGRELSRAAAFRKDTVYKTQKEIYENVLFQLIGTLPKSELDVDVHMSVWRCLYRRQLLIEHDRWFKSEREYISEDIIFHLETYPYVHCLSTVAEPLYFYRENDQSLTKKYKADRFEKECFLYQAVMERIRNNRFDVSVELREQRSFIGRARACVMAEVRDNVKASWFERRKNILKILRDSTLHDVLRGYPIYKMNKKLAIVTWCMKNKLAIPLICIIKLIDTRK